MGPMRTIAVQVSEGMYQKIKEYLKRHGISQKDFLNGLLEKEIERDLLEQAAQKEKLESTASVKSHNDFYQIPTLSAHSNYLQ